MLARTTDLGTTWQTTMVEDNRGKSGESAPSATGVSGLAVDMSGPRDVVYVGCSRSYPNAPNGSPLRGIFLMATSTDGGQTFAEPVNIVLLVFVQLRRGGGGPAAEAVPGRQPAEAR